jgi:hypothetical protein
MESEALVLLSFLGRGFYDPSALAGGSWKTTIQTNDGTIVNTFAVSGDPNANPVHIKSHETIEGNRTLFAGWMSDDDVTYDAKMEVPVRIHDEGQMSAHGGATEYSQSDFTLVHDSFAHP